MHAGDDWRRRNECCRQNRHPVNDDTDIHLEFSMFLLRHFQLGACGLFLCLGIGGLFCLTDYANRPGADAQNLSEVWPQSAPEMPTAQATVAFFYHPKCPCTRATVRNLERFLSQTGTRPAVIAFAYHPDDETGHWVETPLTQQVRRLANSRVVPDADGRMAQQFGATTSGQLLIYDEDHRLVFSGGITPSRGHEAESIASRKFATCLSGEATVELVKQPVFGCSIVATKGGDR